MAKYGDYGKWKYEMVNVFIVIQGMGLRLGFGLVILVSFRSIPNKEDIFFFNI